MSTNDALKSRGNLKEMTPKEREKYIKNRIKNMSSSDTDKVTRSLGLGGGRGGLSMKAQLEGNLPGKKKYKSGGMVKEERRIRMRDQATDATAKKMRRMIDEETKKKRKGIQTDAVKLKAARKGGLIKVKRGDGIAKKGKTKCRMR